jgi:hypothetical protein
MIYEFTTPSDPITFVAANDSIAWATAALAGQGFAGCDSEDGRNLCTMTAFAPEDKHAEIYKKYIGTDDVGAYVDEHAEEIADALLSFAYGDINHRKQYDAAIAAITDNKKLKQFKAQHEDIQRTSMSRWVASAWKLGKAIKENLK